MATMTNFTSDEWKKLLESPLLAGFAISAADPTPTTKAAALKLGKARASTASFGKDRALAELKQTAAILDAKAPADAVAFKAWLGHIAQVVAEAGSEGGFLGFGGVKVSDKEKATLAEINTTLGI